MGLFHYVPTPFSSVDIVTFQYMVCLFGHVLYMVACIPAIRMQTVLVIGSVSECKVTQSFQDIAHIQIFTKLKNKLSDCVL